MDLSLVNDVRHVRTVTSGRKHNRTRRVSDEISDHEATDVILNHAATRRQNELTSDARNR